MYNLKIGQTPIVMKSEDMRLEWKRFKMNTCYHHVGPHGRVPGMSEMVESGSKEVKPYSDRA